MADFDPWWMNPWIGRTLAMIALALSLWALWRVERKA